MEPERLASLADDVLRAVGRLIVAYLPPRRPGRPRASLIRKETQMLVYKLILPPPGAPDVVTRELAVFKNGGAEPHAILSVVDGQEITFDQGDVVTLRLVDIDDAGNRSEPSPPFDFVATDTIAPPAPGAPGVELLREE